MWPYYIAKKATHASIEAFHYSDTEDFPMEAISQALANTERIGNDRNASGNAILCTSAVSANPDPGVAAA